MRLIDAVELFSLLKEQYIHNKELRQNIVARGWQGALQLLYDAPTIDPVHAAGACYCWECKYFDPDENIAPNTGSCSFVEMVRFFDDFCSKGEPKEAEE